MTAQKLHHLPSCATGCFEGKEFMVDNSYRADLPLESCDDPSMTHEEQV